MKFGIGSAIAAVIILMIFAMTFGYVNVHPTEVAVEVNKVAGKVVVEPHGVGYHIFNRWVTDMVVYHIGAQAFPRDSMRSDNHANEWNMSLKTKDGQGVDVDFTVIFSLNAKDVSALHQTVGPDFEMQILLPQIRSEARIAIGGYSAEDLYNGETRDKIQEVVKDKLKTALVAYPAINIQSALMRDFRFQNPEFQKAIEEKKLAAQTVEVNKNRALAQGEEAKRVEAEASGNKLKAIQEAEGRAQSAKIEADASRYKLEQEAAGTLAKLKAEAEGKRLSADALAGQGGKNVVALKFAETIPPTMKIIMVPTGQNSSSFFNMNKFFGDALNEDVQSKQ